MPVENLIESCHFLVSCKESYIGFINSRDIVEADRQIQHVKHFKDLACILLFARDSDISYVQHIKELAPILLEPNLSTNETLLRAIDSWLSRNYDSLGVEPAVKLPSRITNKPTSPAASNNPASLREDAATNSSNNNAALLPALKHHRVILSVDWNNLFIPEDEQEEERCVLGKGSFGTVLKAKLSNESLLPIDVAVKVLICDNKVDFAVFSERCRKEVDTLLEIESKLGAQSADRMIQVLGVAAGLLSPSFADIFGKKKKAFGIVMRLEAGGTLDGYLDNKAKGLRVVEKLPILLQLSRTLAEMHDVNIIHGDIKPKNVLLSDQKATFVRLGDFGGSTIRESSLSSSLGASSLRNTANKYGTPLYNAPEMLVSNQGMRARPSKKTDMYAFSLVCWEVLGREHKAPFSDIVIADEQHLVEEVVGKGRRPDMSALQEETPDSLRRMMADCWHVDRKVRPSALEVYMRIDQCLNVLNNSSYDIFFSHPWTKKSVLRHVKRYFGAIGFRVWYDEDHMQWDLVKSMQDGILKSKVVLACISVAYEKSQNCMFELAEACKLANKPIVTLSTDANPFAWADQNKTHGDLKAMCGISGQGKLFFDIGEVCARDGWDEPVDNGVGVDPMQLLALQQLQQQQLQQNVKDLNVELDKVVALLRGNQINCQPSL